MNAVKEYNVEMLPVDSEHAALQQCLHGNSSKDIDRLILTASGGPFLKRDISTFENITLEDTLKHPNWEMGSKITVDSSTMMNKGLEVIEAAYLFGVDINKVDVVVHPQSIIHSMVEYVDGSVISQMSLPDMRFPIQYALTYPEKINMKWNEKPIWDWPDLQFYKPDYNKFPLLKLAIDTFRKGSGSIVLNAANEAAVKLFLAKKSII